MSKKSIRNKTIWITGASSGIGYELAVKLAEQGNFVIASARNQDKLTRLVEKFPQRITALPADVSQASERQSLSQRIGDITDTIDIVIMCAGVVSYEDDLSFSDEMYQRVFATNFFGLVNTLAVAKPYLEKSRQRAYVVGVSSMSMMLAFPRAQAYGASKAAADYFLHTLCIDLPKRKYDVSVVRPGFIETPMTAENDFPMPFIISAEKAAERIIKGMEKRQRLIMFPGRLGWLIRVISWLPSLWFGVLGPKSSRNQL
jgi:short-subunit dehydrogenase